MERYKHRMKEITQKDGNNADPHKFPIHHHLHSIETLSMNNHMA